MRNWFIAGLLLLGFTHSKAQNSSLSEKGCGTITTPQEMQQVADYVSNKIKAKTTAGVDSIPLSIHVVAKNDGSGRYRLDYLLTVLCQLNTKYAPIGFYFYVKWPIHYINNTNYYVHDGWNGYQMMTSHNVPNTANIYFVDDPNGACGYFSPGADGIAIARSCSNPNSTTLTHELGHYFGLPHTFFGWENGGVPSNPEKVTRGAGANCSGTGDYFCDTDADYLGSRWSCPYNGSKTDVNGDKYHPDSSLYMSYSDDACMTRFSNQQKGRMQSDLYNDRPYLLNANDPTGAATMGNANIIYPSNLLYSNNKTIRWNRVPGAEYYYVKAGFQIGLVIKQDTITADTTFTLNFPLVDNGYYSVTVTPLSSINVCGTTPQKRDFMFTNATTTGIDDVSAENNILLYPNPAGNEVTLKLLSVPAGIYNIQITNVSGQKVFEQSIRQQSANTDFTVPTAQLPNGLYMVRITGDQGNWTKKLIIRH